MRRVFVLVAVLALLVVSEGVAWATKPGPGTSTGTGQVFFPNPVVTLGDESLTDQNDADYAALQAAYRTKTLTNLDGSGFLSGDWAVIVSETGNPAYSPTNTFIYNRHQDEFEQVMAYYWITEAQKYIQSLGFGSTLRAVNKEPQRVRINQWGLDNSFATTHKDELRFGKGGVDDAEDADVILHEYGHAIHFSQNFSFASEEAGAISEGFGDYWAATVTQLLAPAADPACIMDWDSTSYTSTVPHCLRRLDANLMYPADLNGRVHHDGMIWSQALWAIRTSLGNMQADTIILEGQFDFPGTTMTDLATSTVAAAQTLYGAATANQVRAAFQARGILP
jgi:hypothetical protein